MIRLRKFYFIFLCGAGVFIFPSCNHAPANIPFPASETEFSQPVSSSYSLSASEKIKWEIPKPDSSKPVKDLQLDFDKLPSEAFDMEDFKPFAKPMEETDFDLNTLPDTALDLTQLPSIKISFKSSPLGQPARTKAIRPRIRDNVNLSVFEYGLDQGLASGGGIADIFQDSRGLLWISTLNGLYRFDGENFDLYTAIQGLHTFNTISTISEDNRGQIWLGNDQGIVIINLEEGTLSNLDAPGVLTDTDIQGFMPDKEGNMWVCTKNGVSIINLNNQSLKNISIAQGLGDKLISNLLEDDDGNIWMGTVGSIFVLEKNKKRLKRIINNGDLNNKLFKDGKGRILVRNSEGSIDIIDLKKGRRQKLGIKQGLSGDKIHGLARDHLGQLWLSTAKGIDIVQQDSNTIRHLGAAEGLTFMSLLMSDHQERMWMSDNYAKINFTQLNGRMFKRIRTGGLANGAVRTLYQDHKGRIWVANSTDTIYIADPEKGILKHFSGSKKSHFIPSSFVEVEKDKIWMSSYAGGAYIYDLNKGIFHFLLVPGKINSGGASGSLKDHTGNFWFWGDGGISVYNPQNKTFRCLTHLGPPGRPGVKTCCEDEKGNIWICTDAGIEILNPEQGLINHLLIEKQEGLNNILSIVKGENGKILMEAYGYGLFVMDPDKGHFMHFTTKEGLASDQLTSAMHKNGNLYVAGSDGLTVLSPSDSTWNVKNYGRPQLFDNVDFNPTVILTEKNQFWWGLGADGILTMEEHGNDTIIPPMYISGMDIMEQPQYFLNKTDTSYLQKNKIHWDQAKGPFQIPTHLTLPYNQNYLRFHFTGTYLGNTDKTRYRYILEGRDDHWSQITDQSYASYISLEPGAYIFKVSSRGFNGLWSVPVESRFTITAPWWRTWWADLLFVLSAGIIVWGGMTVYRTNRVKAENLRLEENVVQRTKELRLSLEELKETQTMLIQQEKMASLGELTAGIAHEIQNPLNFVNNFSDLNAELIEDMEKELKKGNFEDALSIAKDVKENEEKINHHGKRADAIVKGMLQHSRVTSGLKEPTNINALADEYLQLAYHGLRAKDKNFNATMETHFDQSIGKVNIMAQDIGRVFLNLYNNAFYASAEKKRKQPTGFDPHVIVSTKNMDGKILISVKDNGNGIPDKVLDKIFQPFFTTKPTGQGTGLGLSLSYDIIKAHGGEIKVETTEGDGSEFLIQIPKG